MKYEEGYPKQMVHPQHKPAVLSVGAVGSHYGQPERFPNQTVNSGAQEAEARARGYLLPGEPQPLPVVGHYDYPKMLYHPDHVAAVPDEIIPRRLDNGAIEYTTVKGKPEVYPPKTVNDADEEEAWRAKGYGSPVPTDPQATQRAKAAPHDPSRVHQEYPKMVNGVLVEDPAMDKSNFQAYPQAVWKPDHSEQVIVPDAAAHKALLASWGQSMPEDKPKETAASRLAEAERKAKEAMRELEAARKAAEGEPEVVSEPVVDPVTDERAALLAEAKAKGIKVHHKWRLEKIREAIQGAGEEAA